MQGRFIVFEGGEKSGKSTQLNLLHQYLLSKNFDVILTREPGCAAPTPLGRSFFIIKIMLYLAYARKIYCF